MPQWLEDLAPELRGLDPPLRLVVHPGDDAGDLHARLAALARELEAAAGGGVIVEEGHGGGLPATPALTLSRGDHGRIHYLALPEGREASPFAEALRGLARDAPSEDEQLLVGLERPAELLLFMAPSCEYCPLAVHAVNRLAVASPLVTTLIVDAQRFPQLAGCFSTQSVPTMVLDGGLTETGVMPVDDVATRILDRDTAGHGARVFRSLIETGRVEDAAAELAAGRCATSLALVWRSSATALRLGLMLAAELALERDPASLDDIAPDLIELLGAEDAALRGDTADLLGRIGHRSAEPALKRLLADANADVAEIAEEALVELNAREP